MQNEYIMTINQKNLAKLSIADLLVIIQDETENIKAINNTIKAMGSDYDAMQDWEYMHRCQLIKTFCQDEYNNRLKTIFSFD